MTYGNPNTMPFIFPNRETLLRYFCKKKNYLKIYGSIFLIGQLLLLKYNSRNRQIYAIIRSIKPLALMIPWMIMIEIGRAHV